MLNKMTQFKHTPGPWEGNADYIVSSNLQIVCTLSEHDTAKADAKLIAAAPELLEALIECLEGVKELNGEYQDGWDDVIGKTSLIIKKATE
jgi:hypothetical protein